MQVFTWPGKSIDEGGDFANWSLSEIRERVELVQEFDKLGDSIVNEYTYLCRKYRITDKEILVPTSIKVLKPIS